jgi:hypothetical protein
VGQKTGSEAVSGSAIRTFLIADIRGYAVFTAEHRDETDAPDFFRVWALDLDDLISIGQCELTRGLTPQECRQYLHESC